MRDLYQVIAQYAEQENCLLATVLNGENIGAKALFCEGKLIWKSEQREIPEQILDKLKGIENSGLCEFGQRKIFAERFGGRNHLIICGGGHVSMPVIQIGKSIGFDVTVLEDRPFYADRARDMGADTVLCESFETGLSRIPGGGTSYFVVVTRGHRYDLQCLKSVLGKRHAYVGMMGSRRRVAAAKKQLEEEGIKKELLDELRAPIGLEIGAETPEEIAVAIMAEVIQYKNRKKRTEGYRKEILDALNFTGAGAGQIVLAEIVWRSGSAPREIGTKMVIAQDGALTGTIGGGCMEAEIVRAARQMLSDESADYQVKEVDMAAENAEEEGMVCGGRQLVYLEKRKQI